MICEKCENSNHPTGRVGRDPGTQAAFITINETKKVVRGEKLDGVGIVDNRPSTD